MLNNLNDTYIPDIYQSMGIDKKVYDFGEEILVSLEDRFKQIDKVAEYNQIKVINA